MKRIGLQIVLGVCSLLMLFRFGLPALIYGTTGPGPFGNRWIQEGQSTTLLLDADLRFFGAMMIALGLIFLWLMWRVDVRGPIIYILACAVALGAAARIYARIKYGDPGTAGTIPVIIEVALPPLLILFRYYVGKGAQ